MFRVVFWVLVAVIPANLAAQSYTADEQSLIDAIDHCWNRATTDLSMQALRDACRVTDATHYWWTPETAPFELVGPWVEQSRATWNRRLLAQDLRPMRVQVDGDFGFIYFHGIRTWESQDGVRQTESWRGFEVWKRVGGEWSFLGGTGTPDALNQLN